ncbi:MAG: radical SAM protein [Dehalococcoidia bacterium]|nr:radical SAM protein [Dehalococcoidia bacterium]MDD5494714.1 radical SAM protein [Dehalococcoidia bacterium]
MELSHNATLNKLNRYYFEQGPIRPPSEAYSLLIRATRNCSWNRCQFCPVYKGQKFELRPVENIVKDIETAKVIAEGIQEFSWKTGNGGAFRDVAAYVYNQNGTSDCVKNVALWLWAGGTSAFLQDANTIIMRTPELVRVISILQQSFPSLERITSYCRSKTAAKKTIEEFGEMKQAGLTRIHMGMESGCDEVLKLVDKGMTADDHIKGGKNVKGAAIELSEYYMPGLGGKKLSQEHAIESARVLNDINPDFIRLRTLHLNAMMPLWSKLQSGEFELQSEDEIIAEIRCLVEKLDFTGELKSDHILNLLPELEGKFPEARKSCLAKIDRYLAMPLKDRLNYRLGRRAGYYEKLDDIYDASKYQKIEQAMQHIGADSADKVDEVIEQFKQRFI